MIRKVFIAAILISLTTMAFAQTTPRQDAMAVFDRVYATPMDSCHDASVVLNENLSVFDYVYCGVIGDTYTSINQLWTTEVYNQRGYVTFANWEYIRFGPRYYPLEGYIALYRGVTFNSVASLAIVNEGRNNITVIVLAYNRR